jgi:hypothetical protein
LAWLHRESSFPSTDLLDGSLRTPPKTIVRHSEAQ